MTLDQMHEAVAWCSFPGYSLTITADARGTFTLQGRYMEDDVTTGKPTMQYTRRWLVSPNATVSEVVQTALKCVLTSAEHRVREHFLYKGKAIFHPHYDVDVLLKLEGERVRREDG
jgi:hypothetical protein